MSRKTKLIVFLVALMMITGCGAGVAFATNGEPITLEPIWELLMEIFAPILGVEGVALIVAFVYAFLGRWGNHESWDWNKFLPTMVVALFNGLLYSVIGIATNWTFGEIELWTTQFAGLYFMQKLFKVIAPYLESFWKAIGPSK